MSGAPPLVMMEFKSRFPSVEATSRTKEALSMVKPGPKIVVQDAPLRDMLALREARFLGSASYDVQHAAALAIAQVLAENMDGVS